jgi:integrase
VEAQRNFLTLDELNKLVKTNCYDPMLKRAFLFSCLTGLRKSDITSLIWSELELIDKRYAIRFRQQKTKGIETLWISDQAFSLLGEPGKPEEKVFPGLKINSYYSKYLFLWLHEAGITKKISFHCARHTFATLQISQSTDLYTVSKMLGHKNIKTTAIYAKVIDKLKQDAADRIKLDL